MNYFFLVAEEARELMAKLGVRKFNELIGRADLLDTKKGIEHWKAKGLDFSRIFHMPEMPAEVARYHSEKQNHGLEKALDNRLIELSQAGARARARRSRSTCRSATATAPSAPCSRNEIARRYGHDGLPDGTIQVRFAGSAGQSFGAFLAKGVTLEVIGDTNDYCGKGLSGGRIIVAPSPKFRGEPTENIITGNVVLYGAIAGEAYFRGVAGERFAVRNSGRDRGRRRRGRPRLRIHDRRDGGGARRHRAQLRRRHVGGIAYVLDIDGEFVKRCNAAMVDLEPVLSESEQQGKVARHLWHRGQAGRGDPEGPDRAPREAHRKPAREGDPREVGGLPRALRQDLSEGIPPRLGRARRCAEESGGLSSREIALRG